MKGLLTSSENETLEPASMTYGKRRNSRLENKTQHCFFLGKLISFKKSVFGPSIKKPKIFCFQNSNPSFFWFFYGKKTKKTWVGILEKKTYDFFLAGFFEKKPANLKKKPAKVEPAFFT